MKKYEYQTYLVSEPNDTNHAMFMSEHNWELFNIIPAWDNYIYWYRREIKDDKN